MSKIVLRLDGVLSILTGKLVCTIDEVLGASSALLGRPIFTHEIPAAFRELSPWIRASCPQFADISGDEITTDNWELWIAGRIKEFGQTVEIPPVTYSQLAERHPFDTLAELVDDQTVIVIETGEGE